MLTAYRDISRSEQVLLNPRINHAMMTQCLNDIGYDGVVGDCDSLRKYGQ